MATVEFHATVSGGVIQVPQEYQEQFLGRVRVILMADTPQASAPAALDDLLAHPLRIAGFQPLTRDDAHAR